MFCYNCETSESWSGDTDRDSDSMQSRSGAALCNRMGGKMLQPIIGFSTSLSRAGV